MWALPGDPHQDGPHQGGPRQVGADAVGTRADPASSAAAPPGPAALPSATLATLPADPGGAAAAGAGLAGTAASALAPAANTAPAGATGPAVPPSAPAQVAPAVVALANGPAGTHHLSLLLNPADLGTVQITLHRAAEGPTQVEIVAQHPQTLGLLQHDQAQLHRALDQAGVPAAGRSLSFQLGAGGAGTDMAGGGFARQGGSGGMPRAVAATFGGALDTPAVFAAARAVRAGIDITA